MGSPSSVQAKSSSSPESQETQLGKQHQQRRVQGYTLSPEKAQQAEAFARARRRLYFVGFFYGVGVYLLVLWGRIAPEYRDWAERTFERRIGQVIVFTPLLILTLGLLNLPRALYSHALVLRYSLSVQGWGSWLWDWTKGELIYLLFVTIVVWVLYGVIRRSPRRWWFYFWLVSLPIIVFVVFLEPLLVEPLFFKFQPLEARQPQLVAEIEQVTRRAGIEIPRGRMFEMNASAKWKTVNAYVTGIGASKRVVVWDTTLEKMTVPQTLYVFGHEMGHYVLGHIPKGMVFFAVVFLIFLFLSFRLTQWALGCWGGRWAIRGIDDWASLPLLLLLVSVFSFFAAPIDNAYSRYLEHQADTYGLEVIHGLVPDASEVAAQSFQIEGELDLEEPNPPAWVKFWLYDHPAIRDRIIFVCTYDPWSKGQAPQFVK